MTRQQEDQPGRGKRWWIISLVVGIVLLAAVPVVFVAADWLAGGGIHVEIREERIKVQEPSEW
jgi:hypothetical protein